MQYIHSGLQRGPMVGTAYHINSHMQNFDNHMLHYDEVDPQYLSAAPKSNTQMVGFPLEDENMVSPEPVERGKKSVIFASKHHDGVMRRELENGALHAPDTPTRHLSKPLENARGRMMYDDGMVVSASHGGNVSNLASEHHHNPDIPTYNILPYAQQTSGAPGHADVQPEGSFTRKYNHDIFSNFVPMITKYAHQNTNHAESNFRPIDASEQTMNAADPSIREVRHNVFRRETESAMHDQNPTATVNPLHNAAQNTSYQPHNIINETDQPHPLTGNYSASIRLNQTPLLPTPHLIGETQTNTRVL